MTADSSCAVTQITVRSDRRARTETERNSRRERGVTLHDFLSKLFGGRLSRPPGLRIISFVDELYGSTPQNDADRAFFQVTGKRTRRLLGSVDIARWLQIRVLITCPLQHDPAQKR